MPSGTGAATCANCGAPAGPRFCSHCGQEVATRRGPLLEVGRQLLADWLSLDSRLFRSLGALRRPGRLSELYLAGHRAPFLRPFRLYLLASLALFSTVLAVESPSAEGLEITVGGEVVSPATDREMRRSFELLSKDSLPDRWALALAGDRIERLRSLPPQEIVDTVVSRLRRVLPSTLILFVPFLALGLKLLYVRGRAEHTLYLDHLVFALHFRTALFLALAAAWLLTRLAGLTLAPSALVYDLTFLAMLAVYLPLALRRFYRQSRLWTAVKSLVVLFVYLRLLGVVLSLSVLVAIWRA